MKGESIGLIIGISIGVVIGAVLALLALLCVWYHRTRAQIGNSSSRRASTIPICENDADSCSVLSDSTVGLDTPKVACGRRSLSWWLDGFKKTSVVSASGIPEYPYKDIQKGTVNFTTLIGQGAFGSVYKAVMLNGETVAVKVLADSKQREKEFHNEVMLLGRLHHRNLVNLIGYCAEKGQHILVYVFMSSGSLASHLYNEEKEPLSWCLRVNIALDVARGLEYLHDGAVPPIIHRDIKSSNILLDQSMRARVADFGLSREEISVTHVSNVRGTLGYIDPEYMLTRALTKKSDVYSFGVLLFELVAGRNPHQGLMEYVGLAVMNTEGRVGWEEIVDSRLEARFDMHELNEVADLAYKCIDQVVKKRPSMRDVVQSLCRIVKPMHEKKHHKTFSCSIEASPAVDPREIRIPLPYHRRDESLGSNIDPSEA